jgi:hypothetical protein
VVRAWYKSSGYIVVNLGPCMVYVQWLCGSLSVYFRRTSEVAVWSWIVFRAYNFISDSIVVDC